MDIFISFASLFYPFRICYGQKPFNVPMRLLFQGHHGYVDWGLVIYGRSSDLYSTMVSPMHIVASILYRSISLIVKILFFYALCLCTGVAFFIDHMSLRMLRMPSGIDIVLVGVLLMAIGSVLRTIEEKMSLVSTIGGNFLVE